VTTPEEHPGESPNELIAKLLDLRTFTGVLFVIFGVVVTIVGLNATDTEIAKAGGINISLLIGLIMLGMGILFIVWLLVRPPEILHSHEMTEFDLPEQMRHHRH
jgi:hypothetical protein